MLIKELLSFLCTIYKIRGFFFAGCCKRICTVLNHFDVNLNFFLNSLVFYYFYLSLFFPLCCINQQHAKKAVLALFFFYHILVMTKLSQQNIYIYLLIYHIFSVNTTYNFEFSATCFDLHKSSFRHAYEPRLLK